MTHTLPYTGDGVPDDFANITVKITGEMMAHEGVAFNAEVKRGKTLLGVIENQGNGGGTWFHHRTAEAMRWWDSMVEELKPILIEEKYEFGDFMADETLADRLYENAALYRDLNRKRSPLVRINGNNDEVRIYKGTWDDGLVPALHKQFPGATLERWVKNNGWEVI